jgi:hypothetical protein
MDAKRAFARVPAKRTRAWQQADPVFGIDASQPQRIGLSNYASVGNCKNAFSAVVA